MNIITFLKNTGFLATAFAIGALSSTIDAKKEKDIRCLLQAIERKLDCSKFVIPIFQKDIPYHITKPGQYCLVEDSVFTPTTNNGTQAIQISASNVTLDLNDKTLSNGDLSKTFINVNGILIDANQSNITIRRGTVTGFSQAGIFANGSLLGGGVNLIEIFQVKALNNGKVGVANGGTNGMGGIVMFNPHDAKIYDCDLLKNVVAGLEFLNGAGLDMNNCHCDENITGNFATFGTFAIDLAFGANIGTAAVNTTPGVLTDVVIRNSTFNRNAPTSFVGGGLSITQSQAGDIIANIVVEGVEANDNQGIFTGPSATGIAIVQGVVITTANNVVLNNVQTCRNSSIINSTGLFDIEFTGFDISGNSNTEMTNCQSTNNTLMITTPQTGNSTLNAGLKIGPGTSNFKISDCQLGNLLSDVSTLSASEFPTSVVTQSITASQASTGSVSNCQLNNNTVKTASGVFPTTSTFITEGIDLGSCSDITVEDSTASGHTQAGTNPITTATFMGSISGTMLTVSSLLSGTIVVGQSLSGTGVMPGTVILSTGTSPNTYDVSKSHTVSPAVLISASLTQFSLVAGFKASISKNIVFRRDVATNNTDTNKGLAFGFSTTEPLSPWLNLNLQYVFDSCVAEANTASLGLGGGFDIRTCQNSKVLNCLADGNTIGIRVTQDIGNPHNCTSNAIANNTLVGNTEAGIFDNFSVSARHANAYYGNSAELNGPNPLATNYLGDYFPKLSLACASAITCTPAAQGTPIRVWNLLGAPCQLNSNCVAGEKLDNICIVS